MTENDKSAGWTAYYEKLRRMSPDDPRPVFLLATSYYEAGRLDQLVQRQFEHAMIDEPDKTKLFGTRHHLIHCQQAAVLLAHPHEAFVEGRHP
jgi:hypothetical protein